MTEKITISMKTNYKKMNSQKGAIQISTFAGMAIIAAVVVVLSTIAVIKYGETPSVTAPVVTSTPSVFFTCGIDAVKDIDNNIYNTIQIGDQCWLKENLKVTKNPDGEAITRYCYDNNLKNCETDGGLYDWNTAINNSFKNERWQGICPNGWYLPTNNDWLDLDNELKIQPCDKPYTDKYGTGVACESVGTKLIAGGSTGFEGILAGFRDSSGLFNDRNMSANFSSTSGDGARMESYILYSLGDSLVSNTNNTTDVGLSVRCIKNTVLKINNIFR